LLRMHGFHLPACVHAPVTLQAICNHLPLCHRAWLQPCAVLQR
jgi:hypothetical protein